MKKLTTLLMALMLMSAALWAEETITVSANSSDISEGLDLKVVAKLFAEAKNLEEFETMLNNPDSAFCNLDLNGDGQVDYLRVVETGEGNKRLIVLQAILAKDIYQDVASIYIERDEASNDVSVQVVSDEYVYGTNYIIEPVYVYRPVIYDWFWSDVWFAWHSPWYWGYWPGWWYAHNCWAHDWYWHHCYTFHHHHHGCSFRHGHHPRNGYHELHRGVSRSDYARTHSNQSFSRRNSGMTNAREVRSSNARSHQASFGGADRHSVGGERVANGRVGDRQTVRTERTFGSTHTAVERSGRTNQSTNRPTRTANDSRVASTTRTANDSRTASTTRTTGSNTSHSSRSTSATVTRPTRSTSATISTPTRSTSNSTVRSSGSSSSSVRSSGSGSSSSSTRSSGTYSGGSRSSGSSSSGSYGGGRVSGSSGGGSRSSGGSHGGGGSAGGGRRR